MSGVRDVDVMGYEEGKGGKRRRKDELMSKVHNTVLVNTHSCVGMGVVDEVEYNGIGHFQRR